MPLYTISELGQMVRRGQMDPWGAAIHATDRSYSGLCLECPRKFDGDPERDRGICLVCIAQQEALDYGPEGE